MADPKPLPSGVSYESLVRARDELAKSKAFKSIYWFDFSPQELADGSNEGKRAQIRADHLARSVGAMLQKSGAGWKHYPYAYQLEIALTNYYAYARAYEDPGSAPAKHTPGAQITPQHLALIMLERARDYDLEKAGKGEGPTPLRKIKEADFDEYAVQVLNGAYAKSKKAPFNRYRATEMVSPLVSTTSVTNIPPDISTNPLDSNLGGNSKSPFGSSLAYSNSTNTTTPKVTLPRVIGSAWFQLNAKAEGKEYQPPPPPRKTETGSESTPAQTHAAAIAGDRVQQFNHSYNLEKLGGEDNIIKAYTWALIAQRNKPANTPSNDALTDELARRIGRLRTMVIAIDPKEAEAARKLAAKWTVNSDLVTDAEMEARARQRAEAPRPTPPRRVERPVAAELAPEVAAPRPQRAPRAGAFKVDLEQAQAAVALVDPEGMRAIGRSEYDIADAKKELEAAKQGNTQEMFDRAMRLYNLGHGNPYLRAHAYAWYTATQRQVQQNIAAGVQDAGLQQILAEASGRWKQTIEGKPGEPQEEDLHPALVRAGRTAGENWTVNTDIVIQPSSFGRAAPAKPKAAATAPTRPAETAVPATPPAAAEPPKTPPAAATAPKHKEEKKAAATPPATQQPADAPPARQTPAIKPQPPKTAAPRRSGIFPPPDNFHALDDDKLIEYIKTHSPIARGDKSNDTDFVNAKLDLQRSLMRTEFYSGPVDGAFGPNTEDAVKRLQAKYNLTPTGRADQQVIAILQVEEIATLFEKLQYSGFTAEEKNELRVELKDYAKIRDHLPPEARAKAERVLEGLGKIAGIQQEVAAVIGKPGQTPGGASNLGAGR